MTVVVVVVRPTRTADGRLRALSVSNHRLSGYSLSAVEISLSAAAMPGECDRCCAEIAPLSHAPPKKCQRMQIQTVHSKAMMQMMRMIQKETGDEEMVQQATSLCI